jgi:iron(III) transport system ATP-binding protein
MGHEQAETGGRPVKLRVRGLSKGYGAVPVIREVSFGMRQGEILALLGPSGSGKTTILRLIAGFEVPDEGEIFIDSRCVAGSGVCLPPERRSVGMVFQDYALFPHLTVAGNIAYGLRGLEPHRRRRVVEAMLDLAGMQAHRGRYPHELSGGEQQRTALARALAPCPSVLLMDEPFSNLDADLRSRIRTEVLSILRRARTTTVLVTHDREEAFCLGDRAGVLHGGRLVQVGAPEVVYHEPASPVVARLTGEADFLPGTLRGDRVLTELGPLAPVEKRSCTGSLPASRNGEVLVLMRPDDVDITPDPGGRGVVAGREFRGSENLYRIRLPSGLEVRSSQPSTVVYAPGQRVRLKAAPRHLVSFPP